MFQVAGLGFLSLDMILQFASRIKCNVLNIKGDPGMSFDKPEYYNIILDKIREQAHVSLKIKFSRFHVNNFLKIFFDRSKLMWLTELIIST